MSSLGLSANFALFALAATGVWYAGSRLTRCVDAIAERKNLGRAFLGFLVLATATQLPELVTNSTAALRGDAVLVLNSMFGGVSMQTAVLVIADLIAIRHALTYLSRSASTMAQGTMLVFLLALVLAVSVVGDLALPGGFGLVPMLLALLYLLVVWLLWQLQQETPWKPSGRAEPAGVHEVISSRRLEGKSTARLIGQSLAASLVILIAGVMLVLSAQAIAEKSGLGSSFIGVTLLASATSLPEVSTTLTAVRLGQHSMAVADVFGSNLIMVALLLPSDLLYREGILLEQMDASARFALALGIMLTAVYLVGLILRESRRFFGLGVDSWAALVIYATGIVFLYGLR